MRFTDKNETVNKAIDYSTQLYNTIILLKRLVCQSTCSILK